MFPMPIMNIMSEAQYEVLNYNKYENIFLFNGENGRTPVTSLVIDQYNNLFGSTRNGGNGAGSLFKYNISTLEIETINLNEDGSQGRDPMGQLALNEEDEIIYGTTNSGGSDNCGVLYSLTKFGDLRVLYNFKNEGDAKNPTSGVVLRDGILYGMASNKLYIYNIIKSEYSIGFSFEDEKLHGAQPSTGFYFDDDGNIYGTTYRGGDILDDGRYCGVIFKLHKKDNEFTYELEKLHDFGSYNDIGKSPIYSGLTLARDGFLYGTTSFTKDDKVDENADTGFGTIFKIKPDGSSYKVVHEFKGSAENDGGIPKAILIVGPDERLYGSTTTGGTDSEHGTIFFYDVRSNKYEIIYRLSSEDLGGPYWNVVFDKDDNMYGAAASAGDYDTGGLYKLTPERTIR